MGVHNIKTITAILDYEVRKYKDEYNKALQKKRDDLENLKNNYIPDTSMFKAQQDLIEREFQGRIAELRREAVEKVIPEIEELKEDETKSVQNIDVEKLEKLAALKDIPMSTAEFMAISASINGNSNYWAARMLVNMAEKNGIEGVDAFVGSSLETKFSVLQQLTDQFSEVLKEYPADKHDGGRINRAYLSESVLNRAVEIYSGVRPAASAEQIAQRAYYTIAANGTQMGKGLAISNCLRNAKGEARNILLCMLAEDDNNTEMAINLSGYETEINEFKSGKAKEYRKAQKAMSEIVKMTNVDVIESRKTEMEGNAFFKNLYSKELKSNEFFAAVVKATNENI